MRPSLSEISTAGASFAEDVEAYAAAGFEGIGVWEFKLPPDDEANRALLREHGLAVTNCISVVATILPNPVIPGPEDVGDRIAAILASIRRLAAYEPASVVCLTGPLGDLDEREGRGIVVDALQTIGGAARRAGIRLGLEPIAASQRDQFSFVHTLPDALALLDEAGLDDVGVMVDTFHLVDTPGVAEHLRANAGRVTGVHVSDRPSDPARTDRELPGRGLPGTRELLDALRTAGWDGWLDVEIFAGAEGFGALPPGDAAREAYAALAELLR